MVQAVALLVGLLVGAGPALPQRWEFSAVLPMAESGEHGSIPAVSPVPSLPTVTVTYIPQTRATSAPLTGSIGDYDTWLVLIVNHTGRQVVLPRAAIMGPSGLRYLLDSQVAALLGQKTSVKRHWLDTLVGVLGPISGTGASITGFTGTWGSPRTNQIVAAVGTGVAFAVPHVLSWARGRSAAMPVYTLHNPLPGHVVLAPGDGAEYTVLVGASPNVPQIGPIEVPIP